MKAQEFRSSLNNIITADISSNNSQGAGQNKLSSTDECLSGDHSSHSGNTPNRKEDQMNKTQEIIYEYDDQKDGTLNKLSEFKKDRDSKLNKSQTTYSKANQKKIVPEEEKLI